jgi:uncharacterized protein DUF4235
MTLGGYHMGGDGDAQVAVQAGGHRGRDRRRPAVGLIFKRIWKVVGRGSDAPAPLDSERGWGEVLLASVLQGAIYALVKTAVDRGAAEWTRKQTGSGQSAPSSTPAGRPTTTKLKPPPAQTSDRGVGEHVPGMAQVAKLSGLTQSTWSTTMLPGKMQSRDEGRVRGWPAKCTCPPLQPDT